MSRALSPLHDDLVATLRRTRGDVSFRIFLDGRAADDEELADLISLDGRTRIQLGCAVDLQDYLEAVPDLPGRSEPLDAAIDVTLQSLARTGISPDAAVATLVTNYPALERAVRDAAALGWAVGSTTIIRESVGARERRTPPVDFGAPLSGGQLRYRLLELIGSGAHGDVYLAHDRLLSDGSSEALVAIKVFPWRQAGWWLEQRFIEEATKARRIEHPNVVRVLDRGKSAEGEEFIVYERVDGGTLDESRRPGAPGPHPREAARLIARISRGVQAAHAAGVYHCDLKPANILVTGAGEPKVADFGVAVRAADAPASDSPPADRPVGTLAFMAPEQFRMEEGSLGPAADVYALGAMLYWLLTGESPNGATVSDIEANLHSITGRTESPSAGASNPRVDADLDAICRRAMAPRRSDRYAAPELLAADLDLWLARRPLAWREPGLWRIASLWARRRPGVAAAVLLCLVTLAGASIAASVFETRAREREFAAARAEAQAELSEINYEKGRDALGVLLDHMNSALGAGRTEGVAPWLWVLEWQAGPVLYDRPEVLQKVGENRIDFLRQVIASHRRTTGAPTVDLVLYETSLVYWLCLEDRDAEAADIIGRSWSEWISVLPERDPWRGRIAVLRDIAAAGSALAVPASERSDSTRAQLELLRASLADFASLPPAPEGNNLTKLARRRVEASNAESSDPVGSSR